jgi:hypothetical protein
MGGGTATVRQEGIAAIIVSDLFAVFLGHGTYLSGWVRLVSFAPEP